MSKRTNLTVNTKLQVLDITIGKFTANPEGITNMVRKVKIDQRTFTTVRTDGDKYILPIPPDSKDNARYTEDLREVQGQLRHKGESIAGWEEKQNDSVYVWYNASERTQQCTTPSKCDERGNYITNVAIVNYVKAEDAKKIDEKMREISTPTNDSITFERFKALGICSKDDLVELEQHILQVHKQQSIENITYKEFKSLLDQDTQRQVTYVLIYQSITYDQMKNTIEPFIRDLGYNNFYPSDENYVKQKLVNTDSLNTTIYGHHKRNKALETCAAALPFNGCLISADSTKGMLPFSAGSYLLWEEGDPQSIRIITAKDFISSYKFNDGSNITNDNKDFITCVEEMSWETLAKTAYTKAEYAAEHSTITNHTSTSTIYKVTTKFVWPQQQQQNQQNDTIAFTYYDEGTGIEVRDGCNDMQVIGLGINHN